MATQPIFGVGFTGKMKSGKDTCANMLTDAIFAWKGVWVIRRFAFADSLKQICIDHLGLTKHQCYDQDGKEEYNEFWGMSNREILQRVGTEAMRNGFHPDVWAKITELKIQETINKGYFYIITDVRFPNEAETIRRNNGIIVEVNRPGIESNGIQNHASEQTLSRELINWKIDNSKDLNYLEQQINNITEYIRSIEMCSEVEKQFSLPGENA